MKSFFSPKLYWEGVKKTRAVGIAFTAISTIISALIPFIMMLNWYSTPEEYRSNNTVSAMEFCIPALLIMIPASIILVLNTFSYLNKRSESDFYHAIPFKRSCVYVSFMSAVLSWLALASLLSIAFTAFFFWIHPGTSVALSIPFINLGICFLLGATIAATTAVAMTLTGTSISNLLIVILMLCFVPVMRNLVKQVIYNDVMERKTTTIITSHSLRELEDSCDQLALLHKGGIVFESDIQNLKTSLFKVQVGFHEHYDKEKFEGIEMLSYTQMGSVASFIARGDKDAAAVKLNAMNPVLIDFLPLSLEEVFIYEMEALGYAFKDILL